MCSQPTCAVYKATRTKMTPLQLIWGGLLFDWTEDLGGCTLMLRCGPDACCLVPQACRERTLKAAG